MTVRDERKGAARRRAANRIRRLLLRFCDESVPFMFRRPSRWHRWAGRPIIESKDHFNWSEEYVRAYPRHLTEEEAHAEFLRFRDQYARELTKSSAAAFHAQEIFSSVGARYAALAGKSVGVLTAIAILAGAFAVVDVNVWMGASLWQKVLVVLAGAYGLTALGVTLRAIRPILSWTLFPEDLIKAVSRPLGATPNIDVLIAADRLAAARLNERAAVRLAHLLDTAVVCMRNAVALSLPAVIGSLLRLF